MAEGRDLAGATGSMALGTLISKVTGFLSKIVLVVALGGATNLANAYTLGNTIPNAVYDVLIGGILTSVAVPLLVKTAREHADRGDAYGQRMFTLTVLVLGAVTVVATLAAGLLVEVYASAVHGAEHRVMVAFAYFFMPQIFFYRVSSLIGAILNSRNSFAAPMWTPILNNMVVIVVGLLFVVTVGLHRTPATIPGRGVMLLGAGTTLGIVIQTLALIPALRQVRLLPYTVIGVSVITALLPRMSRHAAARKYWLLRADFSYSIRLSAAVLVPAGLILAVLGPPLCELMFSYGSSSVSQARYIGEALAVFSLGLCRS